MAPCDKLIVDQREVHRPDARRPATAAITGWLSVLRLGVARPENRRFSSGKPGYAKAPRRTTCSRKLRHLIGHPQRARTWVLELPELG